jgi:hypothetical protein
VCHHSRQLKEMYDSAGVGYLIIIQFYKYLTPLESFLTIIGFM